MFEKAVEDSRLRYRWVGEGGISPGWRFIEFSSRRGTLYLRVDPDPRIPFSSAGNVMEEPEARNILGRGSAWKHIVEQKLSQKHVIRKAPAKGNPYGRFPEDQIMAVLGKYEEMEDIDFEKLSGGLGLRVLDEGFLKIFDGCPDKLVDEWDRDWHLVASPNAFRPWGLYSMGDITLSAPDPAKIQAVGTACKLPEVTQMFVTMDLDWEQLKVIGTLDRKSFDSQNKVMKNNSANEVAKLLGLPPVGYEWLHMVAFSLGGFEGTPQTPDNLVLGTAAANTTMMLIEGFIRQYLQDHRNKKARIVVSRTSHPPGHGWYTAQINYVVKFTGGLRPIYVRESFDPLSTTAPTYDVKQMLRQYKGFKSDPAPRPVSDTVRDPNSKRWKSGRRL